MYVGLLVLLSLKVLLGPTQADQTLLWADTPLAMEFSPNGNLLAVGGGNIVARTGEAAIFQVATGNLVQKLEGHRNVIRALVWAPDGKTIVTGADDSTVRFWDPQTGELKHTLLADSGEGGLAFSPDGKTLASGGPGFVKLWNAETRELVRAIRVGFNFLVRRVAFSPDGTLLAAGRWTSEGQLCCSIRRPAKWCAP